MSRVLKQGQTITGSARVRVYQPEPGMPGQAGTGESTDGTENQEADSAGAGGQDTAGKRYALISEEKRKILEHARKQAEQSAARILEEAYAQRDNIVNTARGEAGRIHDQAKTEGYNQGLNQALEDISQDMAGIQAHGPLFLLPPFLDGGGAALPQRPVKQREHLLRLPLGE